MEAIIYNAQGKKSGSVDLPESVFGVAWNDSLMHQVVTSMLGNARPRVAHTKSRGDVRGGGVTHGPRSEKNYTRTIPKKMRAKALCMALSRKLKDGELVFVDSFGITEPKTAMAKKTLGALSKAGFGKMEKRKNAALVALAQPTDAVKKSFRNIGSITTMDVRDLNPVAVLGNSYVVIENPEVALPMLQVRTAKK